MKKFINMLKDESGASAAEYALILAIVGAGIALAAYTLGKNISNAMGAVGTKIGTCTAASPGTPPSGC
jgi:pilus assembly protein Flp/PilA